MTVNVLPDLWDRLAQLDACCDLRVGNGRARTAEGDGLGPLTWHVSISRRDNPDQTRTVEAGNLPEALSTAVLAASAAGWIDLQPVRSPEPTS